MTYHCHQHHEHAAAEEHRGEFASHLPGRGHSHSMEVDHALETNVAGIRTVKVSFACLLATAVVQARVVSISGSVALFGDTLHNFADALTSLPLWLAFTLGRRPPTRRFTYGYGRAEDVAGIFIVATIAVSAMNFSSPAGSALRVQTSITWPVSTPPCRRPC